MPFGDGDPSKRKPQPQDHSEVPPAAAELGPVTVRLAAAWDDDALTAMLAELRKQVAEATRLGMRDGVAAFEQEFAAAQAAAVEEVQQSPV